MDTAGLEASTTQGLRIVYHLGKATGVDELRSTYGGSTCASYCFSDRSIAF